MEGVAQVAKHKVKAFGFVTNPGDPGWVDPNASAEVQAKQAAERAVLRTEWLKEALKREGISYGQRM